LIGNNLDTPGGQWGNQGVDALGWHANFGSEGGLLGGKFRQCLTLDDLFQVVLGHTSQWQTGEWDGLQGHLGLMGLAGWAAFGDWDLGNAHLAWAQRDQVPQNGALAGGNLVSLGNLGWLNGELGAHFSFLLQLRHESWGHHRGGGRGWDHPGGNLQLRLRVDAVSRDSLRDDWLLEVAADTAQLVLEQDRWDNLNNVSIGLDLFEEEPWGLDNYNMVWGHGKLSNDSVVSNILSNDSLASANWDLDWLSIDQHLWQRARWNNLDQVLLQDDFSVPNTLLDLLSLDSEPVEGRAVSSNDNWSLDTRWNVNGIAIELDQVLTLDHASLR